MRYGSILVACKTGGFYITFSPPHTGNHHTLIITDFTIDVDHDKDRAQAQGLEQNGFSFDGADVGVLIML
ncbi:hypothetical protein PIB30_058144 [Stylosanthes scabra]|uniref:Uncharacterized protein n=1 Tax=Stylosanthes scabra TaxID=79078 RepID=A0ABU6XL58_9FABA|nr:hypothetical protein [Stylosanthes scabra]